MPFLMGAPFPGTYSNSLFEFDFRTLSVGVFSSGSLQTITRNYKNNRRGLTFTRATQSTVQTSAHTLSTAATYDDACIGNRTSDTSNNGLVLETRHQNTITTGNPRDFTFWNYNQNSFCGGTPPTPSPGSGFTGPDGTANATGISGNKWATVNLAFGQTRPRTFSSWQNGGYQVSMTNDISSCGGTLGSVAVAGGTSGWERVPVVEGATQTTQVQILDCRNETIGGGSIEQARSVVVDFPQLQQGTYASEAIVTGSTTGGAGIAREDDRLSYPYGSELLSVDGALRFRYVFTPKFSSAMSIAYAAPAVSSLTYAAWWWLLSWGNILDNNCIRIRDSDKKLYVSISGSAVATSTNAFTWSQYDKVTLEVEVGNNRPSLARYNTNGGVWNDLGLSTIFAAPNPGTGSMAIMRDINSSQRLGSSSGDRGQPDCWLHYLQFYNSSTSVEGSDLLCENFDPITTEDGTRLGIE